MINVPLQVLAHNFQSAWAKAIKILKTNGWECRNLVVHIKNPDFCDTDTNEKVKQFTAAHGLLSPKQVAYTIFPHNLARKHSSAQSLFNAYNNPEWGMRNKLRKMAKWNWGTYFLRMTGYKVGDAEINQLSKVIDAINNDKAKGRVYRGAFTIVIPKPGGETVRRCGGPCLNYLAVQLESDTPSTHLGLLAVYRNHDFLERAYGNYMGLCNLLVFLSKETGSQPGPLTCISSRAYAECNANCKRNLLDMAESIC
jgi:hypothetical protein